MLQSLSTRQVFFALALLTLTAMLFAYYYLEQHLGLPPCPLCMTQRVAMVLLGAFALLGALHNPTGWGRRAYAAGCVLAAGFGIAVAGRHVWLQYLPEDQVPACGPSLEYMLDTLPFAETVNLVLMGDGNCAETQWTFLGLSIPEQTLAVFLVLGAISLWQMLRTRPL